MSCNLCLLVPIEGVAARLVRVWLGVRMSGRVVYFDLGDTLGTATVAGQPPRLERFHVFSFAPGLLKKLNEEGHRLGIISNTGGERSGRLEAVLEEEGILCYFDPALRVFSGDLPNLKPKPDPALFEEARRRVPEDAAPVFVGEDARERETARAAGFKVVPHPSLVAAVLAGDELLYVRISARGTDSAPWQSLQGLPVLPLQAATKPVPLLYAIIAESALKALDQSGLAVERLGPTSLPDVTDLFLVRDDRGGRRGLADGPSAITSFQAADGVELIGEAADGYLLALMGSADIETTHLPGAEHGHTLKLLPQPEILSDRSLSVPELAAGWDLGGATTSAFDDVSGDEILTLVNQLSGAAPIANGKQTISSRHLAHADNALAVSVIEGYFQSVSRGALLVRRQRFTHRGIALENVEAELSGTSDTCVIVSAHLDSTAGNDHGYNPKHDPAPGADDDASGVATVLSLAARFAAQAATGWRPSLTLRFVLFNAEEEGLVGSQAYARMMHAANLQVAAVLQLDMVGYNPDTPGSWEGHAGCRTNPVAESASLGIARLLRDAGKLESMAIEPLQIYSSQLVDGDPADGRSDHSSFHAYGVAAIAVSTDFFVGPGPNAPAPTPNANYHSATDTVVHTDPLAAIARSIGRTVWSLAAASVPSSIDASRFQLSNGAHMSGPGRFDARPYARSHLVPDPANAAASSDFKAVLEGRTLGSTVERGFASATAPTDLGARAIAFVQGMIPQGFDETPSVTFVADPVVSRTSAGAAAVHLNQYAKGIPLFQTSRTVRFDLDGTPTDAPGNTAFVPADLDVLPKADVRMAVKAAGTWLADVTSGKAVEDEFGEVASLPKIDVTDWEPELKTQFQQLPSRPSVLAAGPFGADISAQLVVFAAVVGARLAWQCYFTLPEQVAHYLILVSADEYEPKLLYSANTDNNAAANGLVYETNPGFSKRKSVSFPRPLTHYPIMPSTPIVGFPHDWVEQDVTAGNATLATLNASSTSLQGVMRAGALDFSPTQDDGDDQKLLNIFYFCNYMHDFLYILGFDEASGNFQRLNFTLQGIGNDAVKARAHSGAVLGTANMSTPMDGSAPLMNMGLVTSTNRHTAFDADVVFHEFAHGLTNRLVGGGMNPRSLDAPQSGAMGEGWGDFYALTVVGWATGKEKVVTGDWVTKRSTGIRKHEYNEAFPITYGTVVAQLGGGLPDNVEVHDAGEVWCATLMAFTRRARAALGDLDGYRVAWQCVTDGLKLTPANPTFLEARDGILRAIDDLMTARRLTPDHYKLVRRAAWEAFAKFGMGVNASSVDPGWAGVVEDRSIPAAL